MAILGVSCQVQYLGALPLEKREFDVVGEEEEGVWIRHGVVGLRVSWLADWRYEAAVGEPPDCSNGARRVFLLWEGTKGRLAGKNGAGAQ